MSLSQVLDMSPTEFLIWDREFQERPLFGAEQLLARLCEVLMLSNTKKEDRAKLPSWEDMAGWTLTRHERAQLDEMTEAKKRKDTLASAQRSASVIAGMFFGGDDAA